MFRLDASKRVRLAFIRLDAHVASLELPREKKMLIAWRKVPTTILTSIFGFSGTRGSHSTVTADIPECVEPSLTFEFMGDTNENRVSILLAECGNKLAHGIGKQLFSMSTQSLCGG